MTYRQLNTWTEWLKEDLNHPRKLETYLMQCAAETRRAAVKNPDSVQISDFKLKFSIETIPTLSQEEIIRREQAAAIAMVGGRVERKVITREELGAQ